MSYRQTSLRATVSVLFCLFFAGHAAATPISVTDITVIEYVPGNLVTALNENQATDGDNSTAFFVQTARNPLTPTQGLGGFSVRWDFDVSGFSSIDQFSFNFLGRLEDPSTFDSIGIQHENSFANPSTFLELAMPDGDIVAGTLDLFNGAAFSRNELNNYISGDVLSVYTATTFGFSSTPAISLEIFEVTADIVGTSISVPGPTTGLLFLLGVVLMRLKQSALFNNMPL